MSVDYKEEAAREAFALIAPGNIIGLGAGSTIAHLVNFLKDDQQLLTTLTVVTSSFNTRLLLEEYGFNIKEAGAISQLDLYFDGCDQFDQGLNALISGGGIHTREKLLAAMAKKFVLIGDGSKYVDRLYTTYPVVIEVIPEALPFVLRQVKHVFPDVNPQLRLSNKKDGAVITENGNLLVDIWFVTFPPLADINPHLKNIPGILETSLFYQMAHEAIIAGKDGIKRVRKAL